MKAEAGASPEEASRLTNNPPQYQFICKMVAYENITLDLRVSRRKLFFFPLVINPSKHKTMKNIVLPLLTIALISLFSCTSTVFLLKQIF